MSASPHKAQPKAALRRGWCPSTLKPMETGDGWLVRLHPPGAMLTPAQLVRIAALAQAHGNGLIEISARGNMQLRGVSARTHPALVAALLDEHLVDEHDGGGPQRLTLISPLAALSRHSRASRSEEPGTQNRHSGNGMLEGIRVSTAERIGSGFRAQACGPPRNDGVRDLIDAAALAAEIEARGRAISGLPPKFLVVVDGGGALSLDGLSCDLRVVAVADGAVAIGPLDGSWRGLVAIGQASDVVEAILRRFVELRHKAPATIRRLRDLPPDALASLCDLPAVEAPPLRPAPRRAGLFALGAGRFAALAALPFGRRDAATLTALGHAAEAQGARELRLSPWRGLACRDMTEASARAWLGEAAGLGLITRDDDPRLAIQACAGKPACLRAETDAMADAARLAEAAAPLLAEGVSLHVSGCVKSCAHPSAADLTLVGRDGRYDVVLHGATRDQPIATLDLSDVLRRLQPGQDIFNRLSQADRLLGP